MGFIKSFIDIIRPENWFVQNFNFSSNLVLSPKAIASA